MNSRKTIAANGAVRFRGHYIPALEVEKQQEKSPKETADDGERRMLSY
jgi:hypothetical protein